MNELNKEYLLNAIIKSIAGYISENNLGPGDRLPTEMEISQRLKVARSSVREALKSLQSIGILESKPGVGTIISKGKIDSFILTLIFGTIIGKTNLRHLGEIRITLEQGAVPLIIQNSTETDLLKLKTQAEELDNLKVKFSHKPNEDDNNTIAEKEIAFHQRLLTLSGNPIMENFGFLLRLFFYRVSASGELFIQSQPTSIPANERIMHLPIVEQLLERNISKAEEAVRMHLRYWAECRDQIDPGFIYKVIIPSLQKN